MHLEIDADWVISVTKITALSVFSTKIIHKIVNVIMPIFHYQSNKYVEVCSLRENRKKLTIHHYYIITIKRRPDVKRRLLKQPNYTMSTRLKTVSGLGGVTLSCQS